MSKALSLTLLTAAALLGQSAKPVCNSKSQGRFWPEAANTDRAALQRAAQCGQLEMCSLALFRFHWTPLTVNANPQAKQACAAPSAGAVSAAVQPGASPQPEARKEESRPATHGAD